jgi:NAD(P)-dependent dehydrogenase (short-subunit alcohol dehydrogenase family)
MVQCRAGVNAFWSSRGAHMSLGGRLEGRVGIVTGTASGIGRAGATLFAAEGAALVTLDLDAEQGEETVAAIRRAGGRAIFRQGDVSVAEDVQAAVGAALQVFGKLDLLWSNASTAIVRTVVEMTEDEWDRLVSVNLKGTFLLAKYGIPELLKAGDGTFVVTGSISSFVGAPRWAAYCATKGGVLMLCRALALEYADRGIRCNCVCPGSTDTPLVRLDVGSRGIPYDEAVRQDKASHPLNRWAQPEEIAKAALFLSCDDSSFMTGAALVVDGGFTAR